MIRSDNKCLGNHVVMYLKFVVRSIYDSYLQRANISRCNIVSE